ncbi:DUF2335 domain-containing protein [Vreelandella olivaria]|uniref:DUF2335 domain-containing protein n=1 Tax=Vreelandella olivaria TaxID=390919 RepID=UPI00201F5C6B|nr:DUF2335 domain-containing protein [Halomonas olivaria]
MTTPSSNQQPHEGLPKSDQQGHKPLSQDSDAGSATDPSEEQKELALLGTLLSKDERSDKEQQELDQLLERHGPDVALAIRSTTTTAAFQSPLPPPNILKAYDEIVPGAAARIIDWADRT